LLAARKSPGWKASSDDKANLIDPNKVAYFISQGALSYSAIPSHLPASNQLVKFNHLVDFNHSYVTRNQYAARASWNHLASSNAVKS
jgi:hypothetical protein